MAMFRRDQRSDEPEPAINAEELRKRLLGPRASNETTMGETVQQVKDQKSAPLQPTNGRSDQSPASRASANNLEAKREAPERSDMSQVEPPAGPAAVAKMFEPTRVFQERLSKLLPAFDQVERLGKDASSAFELVSELAEHLSQFAEAYAPVKAFHGEVSVLAQKFDPLKSIQNQLTEMSRSFRDNLNYLATVMEPASKIHERLAQLAKAFEPAIELKERFELLSSEFENLSNQAPASPAGIALNDSNRSPKQAGSQRA